MKRILIVDDDEQMQRVLKRTAEDAGYKVLQAFRRTSARYSRVTMLSAGRAERAEDTTASFSIETVEERDVLASIGCDLLQGYLFAKPGKPFPTVVW